MVENRRSAPLGLMLAGLTLLCGCVSHSGPQLYDHWQVDLSQARQQLEELSEEEGAAPLSYTLANLAAVYDAELLLLFREQMDVACPDTRRELVEQQISWLGERKRKMQAAAAEFAGASLAAVAAARVSIEETRNRIEELKRGRPADCGTVGSGGTAHNSDLTLRFYGARTSFISDNVVLAGPSSRAELRFDSGWMTGVDIDHSLTPRLSILASMFAGRMDEQLTFDSPGIWTMKSGEASLSGISMGPSVHLLRTVHHDFFLAPLVGVLSLDPPRFEGKSLPAAGIDRGSRNGFLYGSLLGVDVAVNAESRWWIHGGARYLVTRVKHAESLSIVGAELGVAVRF